METVPTICPPILYTSMFLPETVIHSAALTLDWYIPGRHATQSVEGSLPAKHCVQLVEGSLP